MQFIKILNSVVYAVTYISCYFVGYARDEVLGRNCRFLSGVDTDSSTLYQVSFVVIGSLCDLVTKVMDSMHNIKFVAYCFPDKGKHSN